MCLVRLDQECAELGVIDIAVFQSMVTLRRTISTRSRPLSMLRRTDSFLIEWPHAALRTAVSRSQRFRSSLRRGRRSGDGPARLRTLGDRSTERVIAMSRAKTGDGAAARTRQWVGTWADVEQAQLEAMLTATPAQRLAWLEEAMRLAYASGALGADRRAPPSPPPARPKAIAQPQSPNSMLHTAAKT